MYFKERCKIGIELFWQHQRVQLGFTSQLEMLKGAGSSLLLQGGRGGRGRCQEALGLSGSAGETRAPLQEATKPFSIVDGERRTSRKSGQSIVVEGGWVLMSFWGWLQDSC